MDRGRVGEDRGSKETDGCPLTGVAAVGGCERRNEKGVCGGAAYVISVGAE
jgi:hypothetical protein